MTIVIIFDKYLFIFIENMCTLYTVHEQVNKLVVILIDIKMNHKDLNYIILLCIL